MSEDKLLKHRALTAIRAGEYESLFGDKAVEVHPFHVFDDVPEDTTIYIDVFVYELAFEDDPYAVFACVTNGLSDYDMENDDPPPATVRHELLIYLRDPQMERLRYLHRMAYLPVGGGFSINQQDTIRSPVVGPDVAYPHAFFIKSLIGRHGDFEMMIQESPTDLLWAIPLSEAELEFKQEHGVNALFDLMDEHDLPLVFDPDTREPMV